MASGSSASLFGHFFQGAKPVKSAINVFLVESSGKKFFSECVLVGTDICFKVVFKHVHQDFEHRLPNQVEPVRRCAGNALPVERQLYFLTPAPSAWRKGYRSSSRCALVAALCWLGHNRCNPIRDWLRWLV